ncbi:MULTISPECIES: MBL fold metallo-hydrolase [unclassified Streptomyces]|uniref:MBL fold metallo-hydrolase n=1 Tax=unclassified Streptomyces TaxID=2593676 RepID=UPI00136E8322|nr:MULTISPECIES: MBL fold metallo-hydrolase [unclassified Streptomyces]MCW5254571.1 MBL fold metallo-hydrolase [Streptomyces sp. SHP 1-2]MYU25777.1 MBL fold metallo-hydrolase [Streptomyces sp. SID8352]
MTNGNAEEQQLSVTVVGGPTVVIDLGGLRFVTDPTFDAADSSYSMGPVELRKLEAPALTPDELGPVAAVLLSHDQHPDNLDGAGRAFLKTVPLVLTTEQSAERVGGTGLAPWAEHVLERPGGGQVVVTAVPAQHGPAGTEQMLGAVTGFFLSGEGLPTVYVSGDNVSLDPVRELAQRVDHDGIDLAVLHVGAAQLAPFGPTLLSMTAEQGAEAAELLGARRVLAVHTEGWAHFTEGADAVAESFTKAGSIRRLVVGDEGARLAV